MDTATISILCVILSLVLTVLNYVKNGNKDTSKDGEWKGALNESLRHIKEDLEEIKAMVDRTQKDNKDSIRRLHKRMDDHLKDYHGVKSINTHDE